MSSVLIIGGNAFFGRHLAKGLSPYMRKQSNTMNTDRLKSLGVEIPPCEAWMPKLISDMVDQLNPFY